MADKAIVTAGVVTTEIVTDAFNTIRKGGTVVVTGLGDLVSNNIQINSSMLTLMEKRIQGSLFGSGDPFHDIPLMVQLYRSGDLKLDELITTTYTPRPDQPGLPGHAGRQEHQGPHPAWQLSHPWQHPGRGR